MKGISLNIRKTHSDWRVIVDMSDCYTWSFPEFVPFCKELYYFSNYKDFNASARA